MPNFSIEDILKTSTTLPASIQGWTKEVIEAWRIPDSMMLEALVEKNAKLQERFEALSAIQLSTFESILAPLVRINQLRVEVTIHRLLCKLVEVYFQACIKAKHMPSREFIGAFCRSASRFTITWLDTETKEVVKADNAYAAHLHALSTLARSPLFAGLAKTPSADLDVAAVFTRSIENLAHHLHNRRINPFLARLEFVLSLLAGYPTLIQQADELPMLVGWSRRLFEWRAESVTEISDLLRKAASTLPSDLLSLSQRLMSAFENGPSVQTAEPGGSGSLTIEYVYRCALREIIGDGTISGEEEAILHSLRDYLEIPNEQYQKIFAEVASEKQHLNRDFEPTSFFKDLVGQAMADGTLEDDEKDLLLKVSDALLLDRKTLPTLLKEAAAKTQMPGSGERGRFAHLASLWEQSQVLRDALSQRDAGKKLVQQCSARLRKQKLLAAGGIKSRGDGMMEFALLDDPSAYPLPTLLFFAADEDIEKARLGFKGEDLVFRLSSNDETTLMVENRSTGMSNTIKYWGDTPESSFARLLSTALDRSQGRFVVAIISATSGCPIYYSAHEGGMDLSGTLDKALRLRERGQIEAAIDLLQARAGEKPDVADVLIQLGHSCRALAKKPSEAERWTTSAEKAYQTALLRWPDLPEAVVGLGMLKRAKGEIDVGMQNLEHALLRQPVQIAHLLTYCFYGLVKLQSDPDAMLKFLETHVARAYNFYPRHSGVMDFMSQIRAKFGIELRMLIEFTEVDTRYQ